MHYGNTTFDFLGNSLLEKEKYLVIESSNFLQSNSKEVSKIYCSFSFVKISEIKETSSFGSSFQVLHLFTVLSLTSDVFCKFYFRVKTPLHCINLQREGTVLNQSIQRHFLCYQHKKYLLCLTSYRAETKYLQEYKRPNSFLFRFIHISTFKFVLISLLEIKSFVSLKNESLPFWTR